MARYSLKPLTPTVVDKYTLYIKSAHWTARKEVYYQKSAKECAVCYSTAATVDLNHSFYGDLGQERDEDLTPFCREHHELFHARYGVKYDMRAECMQFIYEQRARLLSGSTSSVLNEEPATTSKDFGVLLEKIAAPIWRLYDATIGRLFGSVGRV